MKIDRRDFLGKLALAGQAAVAGGVGLAGLSGVERLPADEKPAPPAQQPLRPPGALPEPAFRRACVRCYLCAEVCPVSCIQFPARVVGAQAPLERAPGALAREEVAAPVWEAGSTPWILPWERACVACMKCGPACPTGALRPIADDSATVQREVRMGVARIDRKICLPWTRTSWCGACLTICPYREQAITVDHQGRPTVHADKCIGCGLCVEVCPIRYKAISVVPPFAPNRGHVRAE